jgi:hypothetical protein
MSRPNLDEYLGRLDELHIAVSNYLSHLDAVAQGAEEDDGSIDHWLDEMRFLTE